MAKSFVFLEYTFMFDAIDTWQRLSQFENDLADFFAAHEVEANIIETMSGQSGRRIMLLKKVDAMPKIKSPNTNTTDVLKNKPTNTKSIPQGKRMDLSVFETKDKRLPTKFTKGYVLPHKVIKPK